MNNQNDRDLYTIPPNFIGSSTFLGGMFKVRNVIEAGILAVAIGAPVMFLLPYSLMTRIIILCLTALPAAMIGLMGISGESLSSFIVIFFRYLKNRRTLGGNTVKSRKRTKRQKVPGKEKRKKKQPKKKAVKNKRKPGKYERPAPEKPQKQESSNKQPKQEKPEPPAFLNPVAEYFPVEKIENGIIYTKDRRYVKIVEVIPINFLLRSTREQRNIIYSFVSYLKISPIRVQFKVLTRRADINLHMETVRREMEVETNEQCRLMQEDYLQFVQQISSREAVTRRFFLIFEHEPWSNSRKDEESDAITSLQTAVHTASNYLRQCGNKVIVPDNEDEFTVDVLYNLLCRNESAVTPLPSKVKKVAAQRFLANMDFEEIPVADFFSPKEIDFTHGRYILKFINDVIEKKRREFQILCQNRSVPSAIMNGVVEHRNIPYMADTDPAHTLDVFFPAEQGGALPVVINVHGGGLVMGNKDFNRYFCANLCKQGFLVFSIEYRLAPEVTVFSQLDDVAAAVDYVDLVCVQYGGRAGEVFMVGDSAGAFLILYTAAVQRNRKLANTMSVMPAKLPIEKIALISGMFYTTKPDSIGLFLSESFYGKNYRKKPFYPYLDPGHIEVCLSIPPAIMFTSKHDNLRRYTRRLANAMAKHNVPYILRDYGSNPSLTHAFPVFSPGLMQSKQAVEEIGSFFRGKYNILLEA